MTEQRPSPAGAHAGTRAGEGGPDAARRTARRLVGVDAARGLALFGMIAVHTFPLWNEETERATLSWSLFGGNAAALFATLAGVSLAFTSGGRAPHTGRRMTASRWSVVGRAAVIALVGFLLGFLELPADNILVYYGLFFLLAVPFLALPVRHLLLCAALFAVVAPFVMQWSLAVLPAHVYANPSLLDLVTDPVTVLSQLLLTGTYPALPWMTFLLTGIAIGRTDLSDLAAQARLVAAGAGLAVLAWGTSMASLMLLGGYDAIARATPSLEEWQIDEIIVFGPDPSLPTSTLLWLLVPAPHSNTPFGLALSLGVAVCLLGVFLLLSRGARALLAPLAAMGSMTFTLYTSHLLFLWFGVYEDAPLVWFWLQIAACAAFALVWQRAVGQGPLEKVVSTVARGIRRRVLARDTATATPA